MEGAGGPRARGGEAGPVSTATPSPQASSAGAVYRQPAMPRRAGKCGEEGRVRDGGGSAAECGGFSGVARNSDSGAGNSFLARAFLPRGAMYSAGINLSPAHGECLHLRRLVRREHPPASLCASLSRDLLDLSLRTFPIGGERAEAPPPAKYDFDLLLGT